MLGSSPPPPLLSPDEALAVRAIVAAKRAWSEVGSVELASSVEAVASLVAAGLAELWRRPDYVGITLTPYGAYRLGVAILEVWQAGVDEAGESVLFEQPVWVEPTDERLSGPIRLPRRPGEVPLVRPEAVVDGEHGPELLLDSFTGEPVLLFGRTVPVDPRLGRGPRRAG